MEKFTQIVILSGKGGTGKTTISSMFTSMLKNKAVIDCDVDAANLHILLEHNPIKKQSFFGGKKATIDKDKCDRCGLCETLCRFDAISNYEVNQIQCEGCGLCYRACPQNAIAFQLNQSGSYFVASLNDHSPFSYARLNPGEGNSGKLVSEIKKNTLEKLPENTEWIIVDGPPGIGCPVNASLSAADFVVIVTEPTLSGMHDLKRLVELLKTFNFPCGVIINKYDLNINISEQIISYTNEEKIQLLGKIPYDRKFMSALIQGKNILDQENEYSTLIKQIWAEIEQNKKN